MEKRRSPRAGLRARRSGSHAQHAAEAPRRGPASASAGAGRRGHDHDMQCTLDPGRSRDRRAVLLGVPPARTSSLDCAAPVSARRLGAGVGQFTRQPLEIPAARVDITGPGGAMEAQREQPPPSARHVKVAICDRCGDVSVGDTACRCRTPYDEPAVRRRPECRRPGPSHGVRPQAAPALEPGSLNRPVAGASEPADRRRVGPISDRSAHVRRAAVAVRSSRSSVDARITGNPWSAAFCPCRVWWSGHVV